MSDDVQAVVIDEPNAVITNWDDSEKIWHHTFYNELRVAPEEHPVLSVVSPEASKVELEKRTQVMFETFAVPAYLTASSAPMALLGTGRTTGLVVHIGALSHYYAPVYEGLGIDYLQTSVQLHGGTLTAYLGQRLAEAAAGAPVLSATSNAERLLLQDIKQRHCRVSAAPIRLADGITGVVCERQSYELPDGQLVSIGAEALMVGEALFQPLLVGMHETPGVADAVVDAIRPVADPAFARDLFANVVLSGGTTMMAGFSDRLTNELTRKARRGCKPRVVADPSRKFLSWVGGSVYASLSTFQNAWVSKEDYDETGPSIMLRRRVY